MGLLDKLGQAALNAIGAAATYADELRTPMVVAKPKVKSDVDEPAPTMAEPGLADAAIPAQVFGRMTCPFTERALRLLTDRGIEHVYTELAAPAGFALAPKLIATTGQRSVPYVYLRGRFVGGYDGLDEIDRLGQLDDMVKLQEERDASRQSGRTRVQLR